ncbi:unnamed protein product [Trypanosoma congolense IL3000]|uniref:WGS project CAEQ00000000 data, annotated contig 962 n=1 Tax=Trypanosoma congolense (strain IL3000) TaxID=1068625 RepID=F9WJW8_TRYCI|nr:unnamed protein product [Trypanosoma congolense IL3000]
MPKRLAWSREGDEDDSWLPERPQPQSRKEEAALLPEDDEWMVAIRTTKRQETRNPSPAWTMRSAIREVLLEGMKDPHNLNLFDFLQLHYRYVPENVARFTVGDFLRNPERCMKDKDRRKDIGMSMSQMRSRLRERLLHVSYDLFSYHIQTLGDWAKKGRSERVEPIARSLLDEAVKQAQETPTQAEERVQAEEPVQREPRGPRQVPVFLPSSSSSTSVSSGSSCTRRESSPSSDVEFLVESPPPPKKEENSSPHGTQPAPRRKRRASASMESLREASPPMPQEVAPLGTPPTRQPSQESYSDVEFLGANPPPSRAFCRESSPRRK